MVDLITEKGWILWPLIPFSYDTFDQNLTQPAPSPPDGIHWLGTDSYGRDVLAYLIYGFRVSVVFAVLLTLGSVVIGVALATPVSYPSR